MAVSCNPNTLAGLAKCFCFSAKQQRAVRVYLLCQWANAITPTEEDDILTEDGEEMLTEGGDNLVVE